MLRAIAVSMFTLFRRRTPDPFTLPGLERFLLRLFAPAYHRWTGRRLNPWQADWVFQGLITRQLQRRFFLRDRIFRRPYKRIECLTEFGPELKYYLPHAYWHHLNGTLASTCSFRGTSAFYFFSPRHEEQDRPRAYILDPAIPNSEDHNFSYDFRRWAQVPLKQTYRGRIDFGFSRPLVVISNKYNQEWGARPANFLDLPTLSALVELLQQRYVVVYNRPCTRLITSDHNTIQDLAEKEPLKARFPSLLLAEDLYETHRAVVASFNEFQLCLYAQCERFISVQGGNSVLASYFGGTNLVFQCRGQELIFDEFSTIYPRLSGARCRAFRDYDALLRAVEATYLGEPVVIRS
ncbi:hypothetical protein [Opitutus terrae]|uniref:Capsular polysaccharide biosynthesis protein-like protein n=1 Tax=Opitutus terrae (strain DSM 11246 / JCM 15787 / PB90-1) TaxID=452637 RepID=B1ZZF5_OPITP|nr:hypothetical protein [Opitutus terrae]ACB76358.1 hypothetical protein Oter_3078 [Opitutus terrae PB90-1]